MHSRRAWEAAEVDVRGLQALQTYVCYELLVVDNLRSLAQTEEDPGQRSCLQQMLKHVDDRGYLNTTR